MEYLQKAKMTFENQQGEFDFKTKEVDNILRELNNLVQQN